MKKLAGLVWSFIWISTVTLGGGMAMIPFMDREFTERRKWLTAEEIADAVALTQSLPGLIAVNMAVLVGYRVKGIVGAIASAIAVCVVPFVAIAIIAVAMSTLAPSARLDHVFIGIRAATAALVAHSLVKMSKPVLTDVFAWALGAASFLAAVVLAVNVAWIVLGGIAIGLGLAVAGAIRRSSR